MVSQFNLNTAPTFADVEQIMERVEVRTIDTPLLRYQEAGEFAADPVLDSAKELYDKVRDAVREIALYGRDRMQHAIEMVVETWERLREKLGHKAIELLTLFQEQMWLLVSELLSIATRYLPSKLEVLWANQLDTVSAKLAWSASPSVRVAVDGWLAISVGGGLELTATYKATLAEVAKCA